jgi:glycosyltransferase involved in cell wall biosynthesis
MSSADRAVTVIVPSRGQAQRLDALRCAIESITTQRDVCATPLVVLNGSSVCPRVEAALRTDRRVRIVTRSTSGLPGAYVAGRQAVETPWFATLDDDDLLLPGALARRVEELERRPDHAVVVTNGYRRDGGQDVLNIQPPLDVAADPLRALLRRNWLLPGSWLCRSSLVGPSLFEGMPPYLECTFLAARFATELRMVWIDDPTVVYHIGTTLAVTLSREYVVGQMDGLRAIFRLPLPDDVRHALRRRMAMAYHEAADYDWRAGDLRAAWRWHASSLCEPGGWRHVTFTRHLLRTMLARLTRTR